MRFSTTTTLWNEGKIRTTWKKFPQIVPYRRKHIRRRRGRKLKPRWEMVVQNNPPRGMLTKPTYPARARAPLRRRKRGRIAQWKIVEDGAAVVGGGATASRIQNTRERVPRHRASRSVQTSGHRRDISRSSCRASPFRSTSAWRRTQRHQRQ